MSKRERGGALLAVLWLAAALSAIAFSLAATVRAEAERASTATESLRAHYLATGSVERAILWIFWGSAYGRKYYQPPMPVLQFRYPTGDVTVEIIPESSKMNINTAPPADLQRLMEALGIDGGRAAAITQGIVEWRGGTPVPAQTPTRPPDSTFSPAHASFQEIEELLLVKGMTPELFYGAFDRDDQGRLVPRGGLKDCLSAYGSNDVFDANTVEPAVLQAIGFSSGAAKAIVQARRSKPFRSPGDVVAVSGGSPGIGRLGVGGRSIWTIRATARLRRPDGRLSDVRRSAAAMVKFLPPEFQPPYQIMRWYDDAWSQSTQTLQFGEPTPVEKLQEAPQL